MARLSLYVSIALYCGPAAVTGTGGPSSAVAWTHAHPKVELSEGGAVATAVGTGMDGWCTAVCDGAACVMAGSERFYVEIEWLAGEKLMAGVAGASFDPTKGKPGQMSTRSSEAGWAYSAWSDGRLYHDGRAIDWAGFETGATVGDTIGLLCDLSRGTLSLRINGEWQGDMIEEGLKGPLRWTVDLFKESDKAVGSSARIQSKPAPSDPGIEKLLRDAARKGDLGVLGGLLDAGADPNAANKYGQTALFSAANKGHFGCVKRLLAGGAAVETKDEDGQTALDKAVDKKHEDIGHLLRLWAKAEKQEL